VLGQGVKCRCGKHVNLVNVVDFKFPLCWGELHAFPQVTDVVYAVVGCSVDFQNIERCTFGDFFTDRSFGVEMGTGTVRAIECFGKDASGGCLTCATWAYKEPCMGESISLDCVTKGGNHMILPENIIKCFRTVFSGKDLVAHAE